MTDHQHNDHLDDAVRKRRDASPAPDTVWVEKVVHAQCQNCGAPLLLRDFGPGITPSHAWYHPHNSFRVHNGYECDPS